MDVKKKPSNEKRLIDANALISYMDECSKESRFRVYYGYAENFINAAPTVDAVEVVRRGRWLDKGEYAVCTECGGRSGTQYDGVELIPLMTQFCPNCGCHMDGGDD